MIYDGMTTEELFAGLQAWNMFYNKQTDEETLVNAQCVIENLVVTLQMHWL